MNWEAIGAIGEIIGAIAVLATLLYLAQQIRQSNRFAIASNEIAIRNGFATLNEAQFGDTEIARLMALAQKKDSEFDDIEQIKFRAFIRQGVNMWLSIETAYENGMTSRETYEVIFNDVAWFIDDHPGARPLLKELVDTYSAHSNGRLFQTIRESLAKYSAASDI